MSDDRDYDSEERTSMELFEAHEENAQARLEGSRIALKAAIDKAEAMNGVAVVRVQHLADMLAELPPPGEGR